MRQVAVVNAAAAIGVAIRRAVQSWIDAVGEVRSIWTLTLVRTD